MKKVVINKCYGGFGLSLEAQQAYANRKGLTLYFYVQTKYEHRDRAIEYQRVSEDDKSLFAHAHTTDHGDTFSGECATDNCYYYPDIERDDPDLVAVVEAMGEAANGGCAKLKIVEIPDDAEFSISEYDGMEHIAEAHRTWS